MIAFPLPAAATARGAHVAPAVFGCHSCGKALRRSTCCQRARCWSFDDRGALPDPEYSSRRIDAPCDVPANHCAECCPASVAVPVQIHPSSAAGRHAA